MKKAILFVCFVLIFLYPACKKSSEKGTFGIAPLTGSEVDVQKIESKTGISFQILKTDVIGFNPTHKFFWVCLEKKETQENVSKLANAIIQDTIAKKAKTYHSFKIHFFIKDKLKETIETSICFANATFLPEGLMVKVGRIPIDDDKAYKLTLTFLEQ